VLVPFADSMDGEMMDDMDEATSEDEETEEGGEG
jgi:hypothetical protein